MRNGTLPRQHPWHRFEVVIYGVSWSRLSDEVTKMRPKHSGQPKACTGRVVKNIRRATCWHFSAEDKIRIALEGLRGDDGIAELCRKEDIAQGLYYTYSKEFMEAGKRRLAGDPARAATSGEVQALRREARALKECVVDLMLEDRPSTPSRVWNRIGADIDDQIIQLAFDSPSHHLGNWPYSSSTRSVASCRKPGLTPLFLHLMCVCKRTRVSSVTFAPPNVTFEAIGVHVRM